MALAFLAGVICLPALRVLTGAAKQTADGGGGAAAVQAGRDGASLGVGSIVWENAPRVDLVCRTYGGSLHIMWNTFLPSYLVSAVCRLLSAVGGLFCYFWKRERKGWRVSPTRLTYMHSPLLLPAA